MLSLRSKITQSVLLYFFVNPHARIYVNELARSLNLDSGNLSRKLIEIESFGLLSSDWQGDQRYYSLNKSFKLLKEYKKVIQQSIGIHKILSRRRSGQANLTLDNDALEALLSPPNIGEEQRVIDL